ncbi:MAG: hypothetical protein QM730_16450 [Anaerolineales bacterium]
MRSPFRLSTLVTLFGLSDPVNGRGYLGPDTLLPLASVLAAIAGFFLMFWRVILKFGKKVYRKMRGLPDELPPDPDVEEVVEEFAEK